MEIQLLSFTAKILGSYFVIPKILLQNTNFLVNLLMVSLQRNLKGHSISNLYSFAQRQI